MIVTPCFVINNIKYATQMVDVAGAVGGSVLGFIMPTAIMLKMTYDRAIRNDDGGELQVYVIHIICMQFNQRNSNSV